MRQSRKPSSALPPASSTPVKEEEEAGAAGGKKSRGARMQMLRKQLEVQFLPGPERLFTRMFRRARSGRRRRLLAGPTWRLW